MINNIEALKLVFRIDSITGLQAIKMIISTIHDLGMKLEFNDHGDVLSSELMKKRIEKKGRWSHSIESNNIRFEFGIVRSCSHSFVLIEELKEGAAGRWEEWVKPFLVEKGFVQAWVSDVEYDYWQNAKDLMLYQCAGRDYSNLPLRCNDLPPPLKRMEVDTSNNPGRWSLEWGYVEAIGSVMWLGEPFWECVGTHHKSKVCSADWLNAQQVNDCVIRIQASESCFRDVGTRDVQDNLRSLLYA